MDPVVALAQEHFAVDPGAEARATLSISNPGQVVEEYNLEVLGDAGAWMSVEPATVSLFPSARTDVVVVARPPRVPAPPAGSTPFAIRCRSAVDPEDSTVVEGEVVVGGYLELSLSLTPAIARRRRAGKFRATVTNRGNLPDRVRLTGVDPADELRFSVHPSVVDVPGSGTADASVKVKASSMFLKGAPRRQPFDITVGKLLPPKPGEPEGPKASAVLDQRPVLTGAMTFLLVLVALAAAAIGVLAKLNRDSSIESRAKDATPVAVELSSVEAAGVSGAVVLWKAVPDARSYTVEQFAPGGTGGAPEVQQSIPAAGGAVSVSVKGLQPDTQYCFRLIAVTPVGPSQPSEQMCTKTPPESTFPPPNSLIAKPIADTGTVEVTWTPSAQNAQSILLIDGEPQDPVSGGALQPSVSPGTHCFAVVGVAPDGSQTKPSSQSCIPVPGPTTTTATVATTQPGSPPTAATATTATTTTTSTTIAVAKGWLAVVESFPTEDFAQTGPLERAQQRRADFEKAGFPVNLASSTALGLNGQLWILYEDGLSDRAAAAKVCSAVAASVLRAQSCVPVDPTALASASTTTTKG